jgi:hypothetical protein
MLNLDPTTLAAVVEKATHDAANHPRWLVAIGRAILELDSNPYIERGDLHGLIIGSPSGKLYSANGTCQCEAHSFGRPCWHRAAARLVRLHDERAAGAAQLVTMPEGDMLDTDGMRVARKLAATRATAALNELFA